MDNTEPTQFDWIAHLSITDMAAEQLMEALEKTAERMLEQLRAVAPETGCSVGVKSEATHLDGIRMLVIADFINGNLVHNVIACLGPFLEMEESCAAIARRATSMGLKLFGDAPQCRRTELMTNTASRLQFPDNPRGGRNPDFMPPRRMNKGSADDAKHLCSAIQLLS